MGTETIGPYTVLGEIARGGMGRVLRAQGADGALVALKVSHSGGKTDEQRRKRFAREVEALRRLRHPNVAKILDAGDHQGRPYLAMRLYEGQTLQRKLEAGGPRSAEWSCWLAGKLAVAVHHAHEHGVLHRDLKPSNVVLMDGGKRPVLVDFGLTKLLSPDETHTQITQAGDLQGTPGYWAPEQIGGEPNRIGRRTDVYGLGAVLYACLTGRPPVEGATLAEVLGATTHTVPTPPSAYRADLPAALDTITLRCLEKDPSKRYADVAELILALSQVARGELTPDAPAPKASAAGLKTIRSSRSQGGGPSKALVGGVLAVTLVVLGVAGVLAMAPPPAKTQPTPPTKLPVASTTPEGGANDSPPIATRVDPPEPAIDHQANRRAEAAETAALVGKQIELRGATPDLLKRRASSLLSAGDPDGALADLRAALAEAPDDPEVLTLRGRAYAAKGRHPEALRELKRSLTLDPSSLDTWLALAASREEAGDLPGVLQALDAAVRRDPSGEALVLRGRFHTRQRAFKKAVVDLDAAVAKGLTVAHFWRAQAQRARGRPYAATQDLQRFVAKASKDDPLARTAREQLKQP